MELDVGVAQQLEDFQWPGPVGLLATEAAVLENLGRQGKPSGVARLASKAVQWILAFNWTKQLKVWANDARLGREYTQRAARIAWAAEIAAGLSRDTAQCAVELELQRRARRQPGARQSAALAARAALLAGRQGTVALIAANAGVRQAAKKPSGVGGPWGIPSGFLQQILASGTGGSTPKRKHAQDDRSESSAVQSMGDSTMRLLHLRTAQPLLRSSLCTQLRRHASCPPRYTTADGGVFSAPLSTDFGH